MTGKNTRIHVIVAEANPLLSEGLARGLSEEPHLTACAAIGSPEAVLEQCRRLQPCVLLACEYFLARIDPQCLLEQVDYGRAIPVLVLGSATDSETTLAWLRLGCMGYLTRDENLTTLKRAVQAVLNGQIWARRTQLTLWLRQFLELGGTEPRFTVREQQILDEMASGATNARISSQLYISPETVRWHLRRLFAKLGAHDRARAVKLARQYGFGRHRPIGPTPPEPPPVQQARDSEVLNRVVFPTVSEGKRRKKPSCLIHSLDIQ